VRVYGRYYGWRVAGIVVGLMFGAMVLAALAVDGIFSALGLVPSTRPSIDSIVARGVTWNYTAVLNILFTILAVWLFALTVRRGARDPVCGMTVDRGKALSLENGGKRYFFCGPGCRAEFEARKASADAEATSEAG
jgi:YHS domain-containing protein